VRYASFPERVATRKALWVAALAATKITARGTFLSRRIFRELLIWSHQGAHFDCG
jgi:hypothetical protein